MWARAFRVGLRACRATGMGPLDGALGDVNDPGGALEGARRVSALGYEGKWAISPSQLGLANEVFSPPADEVDRAHRILAALEEAAVEGRGAAQLEGRMIDAASARMAANVVAQAAAIDGK